MAYWIDAENDLTNELYLRKGFSETSIPVRLVGLKMGTNVVRNRAVLKELPALEGRLGLAFHVPCKEDPGAALIVAFADCKAIPLFFLPKGKQHDSMVGLCQAFSTLTAPDFWSESHYALMSDVADDLAELEPIKSLTPLSESKIKPVVIGCLSFEVELHTESSCWVSLYVKKSRFDTEKQLAVLERFWGGVEGKQLLWTQEELREVLDRG